MDKLDFFDEKILAFADGKSHHDHHHHGSGSPSSLRFTYYEWSQAENKWMKLEENDPDPPIDLEPGKFDGQIAEVEV